MESASVLSGFYTLNAQGELAFHDEHGQLVVDSALTNVFRSHNQRFLQTYLKDPSTQGDASALRLAVICRLPMKTQWDSETLILETSVLRSLYSMKDSKPDTALTEFQKRSQKQSVFRGMELLLEFRKEGAPELPIFCPVLFDRGTSLGDYPSLPEWAGLQDASQVRVVEVLNLVATIPAPHRTNAGVLRLLRTIHDRVVRKDVRRPTGLTLVDKTYGTSGVRGTSYARGLNTGATALRVAEPAKPFPVSPIADIARLDRDVAHAECSVGRMVSRRVEPAALRTFPRFSNFLPDDLAMLAGASRLYAASAGTELLQRGATDNGTFYLIEGKIRLEAPDGKIQSIAGGTPAAQQPIANLKPRKYSVVAETSVTFLWIPDALLNPASGQ